MYGKKTVGTIRSTLLGRPPREGPTASLVPRPRRRGRGQGGPGDRRKAEVSCPVMCPLGYGGFVSPPSLMGEGMSAVLTSSPSEWPISPVPIIAASDAVLAASAGERAGLSAGLGVVPPRVSTVVYVRVARRQRAQTSSTASDSVSWGKIALGVALLALARRNWRKRPAPGEEPSMPKWLATVESVSPVKALGLGVAARRGQPEEPDPDRWAPPPGLAQAPGSSTTDAVVAIAVFVVIASLTIAGPGRLRAGRRGEGQGHPRLGQDLAHRAQRGRHGRALPRLRRRPHRQGAAHR